MHNSPKPRGTAALWGPHLIAVQQRVARQRQRPMHELAHAVHAEVAEPEAHGAGVSAEEVPQGAGLPSEQPSHLRAGRADQGCSLMVAIPALMAP